MLCQLLKARHSNLSFKKRYTFGFCRRLLAVSNTEKYLEGARYDFVIHFYKKKNFLVSEFLEGCDSYNGPNNIECYQNIWKTFPCLEVGQGYIINVSHPDVELYDTMNLRLVH